MKTLIAVLALAVSVAAQTPQIPYNLFAGGVTYNYNARPAIAGTGVYARLLSDTSSTYSFTVVDALPENTRPFTVSTNFGTGVAQKIYTINGVPIFVPASAGVSYTGSSVGWNWSTGAIASIRLKDGWRILPNVRMVKSSVSASGYQPIFGVLVGWGK